MNLENLNYALFLDDMRHPDDVICGNDFTRHAVDEQIIFWAKDTEMAKWYVENYGMPEMIYFDHDLGYDTSMDFLKWFEKTGRVNKYPPPRYSIHSSNPDGVKNIDAFMKSWNWVWVGDKDEKL